MISKLINVTALAALVFSPLTFAESNMSAVKTYCFGRYLVDIPSNAELKGSANEYIATTIKVERKGVDFFESEIKEKEEKLKSETDKEEQRYIETRFQSSKDKRLILSMASPFGHDAHGIYTYKLSQLGYMFKTEGDIYNSKVINRIVKDYEIYLNQVGFRKTNEIPSDPGFCFENGFVANDGKKPQKELSSLYFRLKSNKDVSIFIESRVTFKQEPSLLVRMKNSPILAGIAGQITTLHEGARSVNGLNGEESITELPSDDKMGPAYFFIWERNGVVSDTLNPDLSLTIRGGEGAGGGITVKSTLGKKEIRALYEQVVKSIRIRPTI